MRRGSWRPTRRYQEGEADLILDNGLNLEACAAEEYGLTILHYVADFDLIAAVTGQPCRWVVSAGTTD